MQLTQEITWKMKWCLPPLTGYNRMCLSFAAGGQCATRPSEWVTGRMGRNTQKVAKVNFSIKCIVCCMNAKPSYNFCVGQKANCLQDRSMVSRERGVTSICTSRKAVSSSLSLQRASLCLEN